MSASGKKKYIAIIVMAALFAAFFAFDLGQYLTLDYLKSQKESFAAFYDKNQGMTIAIYFITYVLW